MADNNPGNFANRSKEEVQAIASKGGRAAHENVRQADGDNDMKETKEASSVKDTANGDESRNPDGTFKKGGGGSHAAEKDDTHPGRREDGTFLPGSGATKEAGQKGGSAPAAGKEDTHPGRREDGTFLPSSEAKQGGEGKTAGKESTQSGRREDGTFLPSSEAAKEAGHKGGEVHAAAGKK